MANQNGIGAGGVLFAFLAGAAAGAAVALLLAPASGRRTREYLADRAREGRDRAAEAAREGRDAFDRHRQNFATSFEGTRGRPDRDPEGQEV